MLSESFTALNLNIPYFVVAFLLLVKWLANASCVAKVIDQHRKTLGEPPSSLECPPLSDYDEQAIYGFMHPTV